MHTLLPYTTPRLSTPLPPRNDEDDTIKEKCCENNIDFDSIEAHTHHCQQLNITSSKRNNIDFDSIEAHTHYCQQQYHQQ